MQDPLSRGGERFAYSLRGRMPGHVPVPGRTRAFQVMISERRKHPRTETDEPAYVSGDGSSTKCRVLNLSAEGAALDVPNPSFLPARFNLMTEKDRVVRKCRIVWFSQNRVGVAFE